MNVSATNVTILHFLSAYQILCISNAFRILFV